MKTALTIAFVLSAFLVNAQSDYFPELIKFKNEAELNAKYIIKNWNQDSPYYSKANRLYYSAYGSFEAWIEFCKQEAIKENESRRYKFNGTQARKLIDDAVKSVETFYTYLDENDAEAKVSSRGSDEETLQAIATGIDFTTKVVDFFASRKKDKAKANMEELEDNLRRLRLVSWEKLEEVEKAK